MSFDLKSKVVALLSADNGAGGLTTLLATYPGDATRPAIINSTMTDLAANGGKPAYPCVTFRDTSEVLLSQFRPSPAEANAGFIKPKSARFDFEIWTANGDGGAASEAIYKRISAVLAGVTFTTAGGANVQQCVELTTSDDMLDETLNVWFRLVSYGLQIVYPN